MESIEELGVRLKGDISGWEGEISRWAYSLARTVAKGLLEGLDEHLRQTRGEGLEVVGLREHSITTLFGDMRIRRRLYQGRAGEYRFLLDEAMGLRAGSRVSPKTEELATFLCSYLPFAKCERLLGALLPDGVSHTTIHRLVGKVVGPYLAEEEKEIEEVFEGGVIPGSEGKVVPHLMVEADGVSIALQREVERRTEIKVGIAYEGWEPVGRERYRLKEKTSYAGVMDGERFWEGFSLTLAKKYDLARVGKVVVGGDGAVWAREGAEVLGGTFQLSRFHLRRALLRGLKGDVGMANRVYQACISGDRALADALLVQVQGALGEEDRQEIVRLRGYLNENACGLADYRLGVVGEGLRGIGAIEGNVDKLIAIRMKKRGMSWSKMGGNRMARLINLRERGQLHSWMNRPRLRSEGISPSGSKTQEGHRPAGRESGPSLAVEGNLPALYGPHAGRPWARVLRMLAHGTPEGWN